MEPISKSNAIVGKKSNLVQFTIHLQMTVVPFREEESCTLNISSSELQRQKQIQAFKVRLLGLSQEASIIILVTLSEKLEKLEKKIYLQRLKIGKGMMRNVTIHKEKLEGLTTYVFIGIF